MTRLRFGAVVSDAFVDYLETLFEREQHEHPGEVFVIEYLRCVDGKNEGKAWWTQCWVDREGMPEAQVFPVGGVEVFMAPSTVRSLSERYIDFKNDEVHVV